MKKEQNTEGNNLKFRSFVVLTGFFGEYWQKTLLDDLPGGRGGELM